MGLFSKKTVTCSCCGKEFQTRISHISFDDAIFQKKFTGVSVPESTARLLDENGYIVEEEIQQIMRLNKMFPKNFWKDIGKKLDG